MTEIDSWRSIVDEHIVTALDRTARALRTAGPHAAEIIDPVRSASRGGKRLRALLLLAAHRAYAGQQQEAATEIAAALELFQTAALLHDDVLDDSDTRRGQPAAHRVIAQVHADGGWHGDSGDYGAAGGILAGDLALMTSQRALAAGLLALPPARAAAVSSLYAEMTELVTAGQYIDMRAAAQPVSALGDQHDEIVRVMRSKTASYSCEQPLAIGAAAAGASTAQIEAVRAAGVDLGLAFQLRDDVLGLVGSAADTGKPAGDDVREGKRTLVIWRAWTAGDAHTRELIEHALGDRSANETQIAQTIDAIRATDALSWTEARIADYARSATSALDALDLAPGGRETLAALIDAAVSRRA